MVKRLAHASRALGEVIGKDLPHRPASWHVAVDATRLLVMLVVAWGVFAYGPHDAALARGLVIVALLNNAWVLVLTVRGFRPPHRHIWAPLLEVAFFGLFFMATGGANSPFLRLILLQAIAVTFMYGSLIGAMISALLTLMLLGLVLCSPLSNPIEGLMILLTVWGGYSALSLLNSAAMRAQLEAQAQAARAQELQSLNGAKYEFISIVSHELRTPLTVINGYGKMLRSGLIGSDPAELLDVSREISKAADRMGLLIDELLDFGRLHSGQLPLAPEHFTYDDLVRDVVRVMGVLASEREQRLQLTLQSRPIPITADSRRIEQVLINLLHNALKYSPAGTEVRVSVRLEEDRVRTEVQDEGPGIAPEHMTHLFSPFYRAGLGNRRVDVEGIGLGLAICQGIVTAHEGQIGVECTSGKGSVFWFDLPLAGAACEPAILD